MTISMKGIVLLVVVQISVVLCASTGKPSDKDLEGPFTGIPADVVQDGTVVQLGSIISKGLFSGISAGVVQDGTVVQVEKIIPSDTSKILEKQTVVQDGTGVQLSATIPSKMSYDDYTYKEFNRFNSNFQLTAYGIAAIIFSVFALLSFIFGCILYFCCKKNQTRTGFIVNYSGGQVSMMPQSSISQPGFVNPVHQQSMSQPGFVNPVHQQSMSQPGFVQPNQQQNIYPSVQATKQ